LQQIGEFVCYWTALTICFINFKSIPERGRCLGVYYSDGDESASRSAVLINSASEDALFYIARVTLLAGVGSRRVTIMKWLHLWELNFKCIQSQVYICVYVKALRVNSSSISWE
jgi:hypothetical protein